MKNSLLFLFVIILFQCVIAQKEMMPNRKLRQSFTKLVESNFEIIGDTVKTDKSGVKHWLVTLKPRKEGFYTIRHIYKNSDNWGRKNNSSEFQISVGSKINNRIFDYDNSRNLKQAWFDMRLGDEIIVPISLDEHIIKNEFSKESRYGADHNFDKEISRESFVESNFLNWNIENSVAELECLGISRRMIPKRSLDYSVSNYATFRAKSTGKFNLKIDNNLSIPITIFPQDKSIKTLVGYKDTYEWETGVSSAGGDPYFLENATLRIGDLVRIRISRYNLRYEDRKEKADSGKIVFEKSDFILKKTGYDYWIND
jgi:hypothetical protein